ncbi:MAG: hypothetical protein ACXVRQ_10405, partial [Gaiellaceae bacterium]
PPSSARHARPSTTSTSHPPPATNTSHRIAFADVLRLASEGLNTTEIARKLGHPVGSIRTSIRLHNHRWQRDGNTWRLKPQPPNERQLALAIQTAELALAGATNNEIAERLGCSIHRIPRLLGLAGYRRTRGHGSRVVTIRRDEEAEPLRGNVTPLSTRRLEALTLETPVARDHSSRIRKASSA